jgi:hypothetical protein
MASITLSGKLLEPGGFFAIGDKIRFTHETNTGKVVKSSKTEITIPTSGSYFIELQYGMVRIDYQDVKSSTYTRIASVTVNQDSTATTIPELLNSSVPPTDEQLLEFQELLQDCKDQVGLAEGFAEDAAQSAEDAAQSAADAAQSAEDAAQSQEVLPEPDVFLPFNNKIVDSLGGELSFSRASATTNVNKSGFVEVLGVDEPSITKDGISSYDEYTNSAIYSEDFSQWSTLSGSIVDIMNHTAPDGSNNATKISISSGSAGFFKSGQNPTLENNLSVWARGENGGEGLRLGYGGGGGSSALFTLTKEWKRYGFKANATSGDVFSIYYDNSSNSSIYIWGAQSTETLYLAPYVKTDSVPVTRAPDIVSIPVMNNIPAKDEPFTIVLDANIPELGKNAVFRIPSDGATFTWWRFADNDGFLVNGYTGANSLRIPFSNSLGRKRYCFKYDGVNASVFADGVKYDTSAGLPDIKYDSSPFLIGRASSSGSNSASLDNEISNFRIYHRALTDAQIAKLGGAE